MDENAGIGVRNEGGNVEITASGSLVLWNSDEMRDALREASLHAESVAVDIRGADFIDTAIIQYLAKSAVTLRSRGKQLRVILAAGGYPKRALEVSGIGQLMDVCVQETEQK